MLGEGQEASPQRSGREPADQRAFGELDDQAGQARRCARRPGRGRGRGRAGRDRWKPSSSGSSTSSSRPEQRLVKEIIADPKAVHAYLDLAEIYRRHSDFDKAEKVLAKGLKANPDDPALQAVYEDTQISRLKRAIECQSQRVLQHPGRHRLTRRSSTS